MHALFVGDEPEAEELAWFGGALVDGAVEGFFKRRYVDFDAADLRAVGAVRGFGVLPKPTCAALQASRPSPAAGLIVIPSRQGDHRALQGRGRQALRRFVLGNRQLGVEAGRRGGFGVGRDRGEARVRSRVCRSR